MKTNKNKYIINQSMADETYIHLLKDVLQNGTSRGDRTGTGTISCFGRQLRFDISQYIPILTTKKIYWKSCLIELLWFLRGETNVRRLQEKGVKIWNGNSNNEFLERNGLSHLVNTGELGPIYGFQWRHFGGKYTVHPEDPQRGDGGFDQIKYIITELKTNPYSRRLVLSAWNPMQMGEMALPPCHVLCQFYVEPPADGEGGGEPLRLSCHLYQRSVDVFLGLPFNILSYSILTSLLSRMCGMVPHELIISTGDTHIYMDHIEQVREQITRVPYCSPRLVISSAVMDKQIEEITVDDFNVLDYQCHPAIIGRMSA